MGTYTKSKKYSVLTFTNAFNESLPEQLVPRIIKFFDSRILHLLFDFLVYRLSNNWAGRISFQVLREFFLTFARFTRKYKYLILEGIVSNFSFLLSLDILCSWLVYRFERNGVKYFRAILHEKCNLHKP